MFIVPVAMTTLLKEPKKTKKQKRFFVNKKRFVLTIFEFYSRWKGLLAPITKTHFQTAPICPMQLLFLLLSVRFGLQRPLTGPRGPNEPQIVFLGTPQSEMTVIYRSWAHYSPPTTSGELFRPFWTKSELSTLPRE